MFNFIRKSLMAQLIMFFVFTALVGIAVVAFYSYNTSKVSLERDAFDKLAAVAEIKTSQIKDYFKERIEDTKLLATMPFMKDALVELSDANRGGKNKGYTHKGLLNYAPYKTIYDKYFKIIENYRIGYGYIDIFIFSPNTGRVLFSTAMNDDFGTELVEGGFDSTLDHHLAKAWRKLKRKKITVISDVEKYEPSNNESAMFVLSPIFSQDKYIGAVGIRISFKQIDFIMQERSGLGETGETYLVGSDYYMRSDSRFEKESTILKKKIETDGVIDIFERKPVKRGEGICKEWIYDDYRGKPVLGHNHYIQIGGKGGLEWAFMSEIDEEEAFAPVSILLRNIIITCIIIIALIILLGYFLTRSIARPIVALSNAAGKVSKGDLDVKLPPSKRSDEVGNLSDSFNVMVKNLQTARDVTERDDWLKTGLARLNEKMSGDLNMADMSINIISELTTYLGAQLGAMYLMNETAEEGPIFTLMGSYAYKKRKNLSNQYKLGEGMVGQAALEKQQILIRNVPEDYIKVTSGLGEAVPQFITVTPILHENLVKSVVEIGSLHEITDLQMEYLAMAVPAIGINLQTVQSRDELAEALQTSQTLNETLKVQQEELQSANEELQTQQEELQTANEELKTQTEKLQASEEELKTQQEELQVTNEELEEKTQFLEQQKDDISGKNRDLEQIRTDLEQKARELEITSKYKSEFLANMSHELRTPLNSLLILSQDLAYDKKQNLTKEQVESAGIIHSSGVDLLKLIDEILDLSKIEAGKMTVSVEEVYFADIEESIKDNFKHVAAEKGLELFMKIGDTLPKSIQSDRQKLEQIIKNLMSNAIKFTNVGSIKVDMHRPAYNVDLSRSGLNPREAIAISVIDTGIGIPEDKRLEIFGAFQQVDGSTSREYGGTGLGLSISKELVKLIGGEIQLDSKLGDGSVFTIYIPENLDKAGVVKKIEAVEEHTETRKAEDKKNEIKTVITNITRKDPSPMIEDDRSTIKKDDRIILVIEDDLNFAKVLYKFCKEMDFKFIHAGDGETGLEYATKYKPDAIILDIQLPGIEGWTVLEILKENINTRHIPVHMMSVEEETIDAYKKGAIGYLTKPIDNKKLKNAFKKMENLISRDFKNLLLVEDDENLRKSIIKLIGNDDVKLEAVGLGKEAVEELKAGTYDCMILDLNLPDISGFEVLKILNEMENIVIPPIIVHTGKDLTRDEELKLQEYADSIIIKGVKSQERLLDETAMFLHRVVKNLPNYKQKMITKLHDAETLFKGKKIMLVDDDMRNVFAITKILQDRGLEVFKASNGKIALDVLDQNPTIDLVLMDIMMPVMDGYEAIRHIRSQAKFRALPILAVTAKAMEEDRQKCIEVGANDYIAKPLDIDKLLSLMRIWLYK